MKPFLEVFEGLTLTEQMKDLLKITSVTKVTMTSDRTKIRIYIQCPRLIHNKNILSLENGIKDQLFPGKNVAIKIIEDYPVGEKYTPETLLSAYLDSLLCELRVRSVVEYFMLRNAKITFPGADEMLLEVEDGDINREKAPDLCRFLEKVFGVRCHIPVTVHISFVRSQKTGRIKDPETAPAYQPAAPEYQPAAAAHQSGAPAKRSVPAAKKRTWTKKKVTVDDNDPDMIYGRNFEDNFTDIDRIEEVSGEITIHGCILSVESRVTKNGKHLFIFPVTDYRDTVKVKMFTDDDAAQDLEISLKPGIFVAVHGAVLLDSYESELTVTQVKGIRKCADFRKKRMDDAPKKRVELHCHTKMSDMDGASDVGDIIRLAHEWGMSAIAITDHGGVQSFPDAMKAASKYDDLKVIYGVEGYLIDDDGKEDAPPEALKKERYYHVIILAKNDVGRRNLYYLVSMSHLRYYSRRPRIPKSLIAKNREGLIISSACVDGQLYQEVIKGAPEDRLIEIASFYDYLEIQPLCNNAFLLRDPKMPTKSEEEIKEYNRHILALGDKLNKPVCATGDVHFLSPEDDITRKIVMYPKIADADNQPPLYLRTTEEMLREFDYLGERAEEVVITNTNLIADMCERIEPVRPDKRPPVIENSGEMLRDICYDRAHELYGDDLPATVKDRMEKELTSIIANGYAFLYIIAQKLVWKSNEDGYLVGSRGSVGSSFVAYLAGITEVNSLTPHYLCPDCHYSDFDSEDVRAYSSMAGCDLPDKICPVCGQKLSKLGFNIPFETFLGFLGDKEPDIDLNFSGEYQSKAHDYTEVIFGKGQTYRAGTIGTLADKTAYGMVMHYFEDHGIHKRSCEVDRIVHNCVGIRRTTGQHPGGIVVLPIGDDIYSFTPMQYPANDPSTGTITTHFDYHAIDHNLLKLDILGHDDPTMIRMLQDLTGLDPVKDIPFDDRKVMSLFQDTSALGITPDDIGGCRLGSLGVPEFGTDNAIQMLLDAKPKYFSDLVRISGLAHGTNVWHGNAKELILNGQATIQSAICCRDDIMMYLIDQGLEKSLAFNIMESVRRGRGLKPEWTDEMKAHGVPDWYIDSCSKIKYMFPKAHAAAYVMMAWRIAYCKVYYPLEYYCAYFSIRANGFSYQLMCRGREELEKNLEDYKRRINELKPGDLDTLRDMRIVQEMYARGYSFTPIDLYTADATRFKITDGKLMPSFLSITGMGPAAAETLAEAAAESPFLSKEDLCRRGKISAGLCDQMDALGILGSLPATDQLSLFDMYVQT